MNRHIGRTQFGHSRRETVDHFGKPGSLAGGYVLQLQSIWFHSNLLQDSFGSAHHPGRLMNTRNIVAVFYTTANNQYAICAIREGPQNKVGVDSGGAHHPYHPDV
jgi:hypothetical protein